MPIHLLGLPPEIIDTILARAHPRDILSAQTTCHALDTAVRGSIRLAYRIACWAAGVVDIEEVGWAQDGREGASYSERIAALRARENAWRTLTPRLQSILKVPFVPTSLYDLTAGVVMLGRQTSPNAEARALAYLVLDDIDRYGEKVTEEGKPGQVHWKQIYLPKESKIVDFGLSVLEHDLCAILTVTRVEQEAVYDLHFRTFSNRTPHALAKAATLHICSMASSLYGRPAVLIEIVGDLLAMMLVFPHAAPAPGLDRLYIVEWMTGAVHDVASFESRTHNSLAFLDSSTLLLPNMSTPALDIYRITRNPVRARRVCSFLFPPLCPLASASVTACRAEPNVMPHGVAASWVHSVGDRGARAFRDDPERALVLMHISLVSHFRIASLAIVVRRSALLAHALGEGEYEAEGEHEIAYSEWGDDACWLPQTSSWITRAAGQRHVYLEWQHADEPRVMKVCDFNPIEVRRVKAREREERARLLEKVKRERELEGSVWHNWEDIQSDMEDWVDAEDNENEEDEERVVESGLEAYWETEPHWETVRKPEDLYLPDFFEGRVKHGLEYVERTYGSVEYTGVWMDENRILGVLKSVSGISELDILSFG